MLVESVSVKNFKLLGDFSVGGLRQFTLVGGDNGVGKTTLLEAILLCFSGQMHGQQVSQEMAQAILPMRDIRLAHPTTVGNLFHGRNVANKIGVECHVDKVAYRAEGEFIHDSPDGKAQISLDKPEQGGDGTPSASKRNFMRVSFFTDDAPQGRATLSFNQQSGGRAPSLGVLSNDIHAIEKFGVAMFMNGFLNSNPDSDAENLSHILIEGEENAAVDAMKIIVPQLRQIALVKVNNHRSHIFVQLGNDRKKIPAIFLGGGACKLLSLVLFLHSTHNVCFLLDEVTVGWHHSHLIDLWRMIFRVCREHNHQVIATTHSREGIGAFAQAAKDEDCQDDACYIRLDNVEWETDPKRKIKPSSYSGEKLRYAVHEMETEVR